MGLILHSSAIPPPRARYKSRLLSETGSLVTASTREESCANPVLPAQGACLRANARTKTAAQPHVLTGMAGFSSGGWLMPRLIRAAVGGAPPAATLRGHQWVEPVRGRDRRANGRRTCTAERQCNSPSRGFLSIRPGHSLDDDGASGFDPLPTIVSLNGDDGPCP